MESFNAIIGTIFLLINWKYACIYLLIINVVGFCAMGIDKYKAKNELWRIPEATLMALCTLGGGIGTILGMKIFHHKTKKLKFSVGMPTILICEIVLLVYCFIRFYIMV